MEDDLPSEFDLVVVGTGFVESIIAAAASRLGKPVLHIDPNDFYGGTWASFNLEALQNFFNNASNHPPTEGNAQQITENFCNITNIKQQWHDVEMSQDTEENTITKENVMKEFRKFNIDLTPKLLFSCGRLVNLLISSNICRYAEFRAVDRICTIMNGQTKNVPCSRTDVFNNKDLSIVEKRLLMKLLTTCMSYDDHPEEFKEYENKTFLEYLKGNRLTDNIIHCVLYAISMSDENTSLIDGIERTKKFLHSLGRYGNTPFLFPMYGCGEIPQCFCRCCAVFGGIYCLKRPVGNFTVNNGLLETIKIGNQEIKFRNILIGHGNIPIGLVQETENKRTHTVTCGGLARAILISSTPLGDEEINAGGGGVNLMKLTSNEDANGAYFIQLSHYSGTCPKGLYLIHITCKSKSDNPEADLKPYLDQILNTEHSPKILYSLFYTIPKCVKCNATNVLSLPKNVYTTCAPFFELDYDQTMATIEGIFCDMYPGEEFLPRAPDPEEIVIGDEDPEAMTDDAIIHENITDQIKELQEGFENQVKCIEDNSRNEEMDTDMTED